MNLAMLLEMAADGLGPRIAFGSTEDGMSYETMLGRARRTAAWVEACQGRHGPVDNVGLVDLNSEAVPLLLYGSALAGRRFVPVNYRLSDDQLDAILRRMAPAVVVVDPPVLDRVGTIEGITVVPRPQFLREIDDPTLPEAPPWAGDPEDIAVLLFTSGTTGEPKAAVLRHRHLVSYIITTVEFMGADEGEAALVSVPPYHVAGISAVLSSVYAGRRVVQMAAFSPQDWVATARREAVTHAMVVPTMLGRILDVIERDGQGLPSLRALSYGGGRMPVPVVERALRLLPRVDFVNAYGLTETSSTIAVLGPDDHRDSIGSDDPKARARLGSVGRPLPTLELTVRDADGLEVSPGQSGEIWVRGEQVSGEYLGRSDLNHEGWFQTRDGGYLDEEGYLFVEGRIDDVIVRGGENVSPGEIEDVLLSHPGVDQAAVVGVPDNEWGERVVAAVVVVEGASVSELELQDWVRARLRSSRTPEQITFRPELPYNETGKLLRRILKAELS